jgi:putative ABC transport system permease protein
VRQAVRAAAPGVVIGLALASVLGVAARSALYEVSPADPVALSVAVAALVLVVLIAGYLPGRAATTMDPASILRQ